MAPYIEPASNRVGTTAPDSGRGPETGCCAELHAATPAARNAIAAACLTCSTSNPGVSFARSPCPARTSPVEPSPATASSSARFRSEEHTSELQSHLNLVCRLLLEK